MIKSLQLDIPINRLLLAMLAVILLIPSAFALRKVKIGDQLPQISLSTLDGKILSTDEFAGEVMILLYLRPGQKESLEALQLSKKIAKIYPGKGLRILAIVPDEEGGAFLKESVQAPVPGLTLAIDPQRRAAAGLGIMVSPTTLIVDKKSFIRFQLPQLSPAYQHQLRLHISYLMGKLTQPEHDAALTLKTESILPNDRQLSHVRLAREQLIYGQSEQALNLIEKLLAQPSIHRDLLLTLKFLAYFNLDQEDKAITLAPTLRSQGIEQQMVHMRLALYKGELNQIESLLGTLATKDPESRRVIQGLGRIPNPQAYDPAVLKQYKLLLNLK